MAQDPIRNSSCFSKQALHALAQRELVCEKTMLDLDTKNKAYEELINEGHTNFQFWQEPGFVIGGFVVSFSLGAAFVGTHCFGMCK